VSRYLQTELSLQAPAHAGSSLADFSALKMEAILSSETSIHTKYTRRPIPEDGMLHNEIRCLDYIEYAENKNESQKVVSRNSFVRQAYVCTSTSIEIVTLLDDN
jgi:hypothetical protein